MKSIKYFIQFLIILVFFLIFKVLGLKYASNFSSKIFALIGPLFRSKKTIELNILRAIPDIDKKQLKKLKHDMWSNYGRILSEYVFIKDFRKSKPKYNLQIEGQEILEKIKTTNKPVIFISGHFNNFELMAMHIEKTGINLAAIYRPLNNKFLNFVMERIRKKYICKNQIKKGINGVRETIDYIKKNYSIALMIDQRVSEGEKINFFGKTALTTTLPAQLSIKFNLNIVPVFIKRSRDGKFNIEFQKAIVPNNFKNKIDLTKELNRILEKMIVRNPNQWIWTHNRWK